MISGLDAGKCMGLVNELFHGTMLLSLLTYISTKSSGDTDFDAHPQQKLTCHVCPEHTTMFIITDAVCFFSCWQNCLKHVLTG